MREVVRESPLAGRFFPADADELRGLVDGLLASAATGQQSAARPAAPGVWPADLRRVRCLVVPHAALAWSGATAAAAYARLSGASPRRVVLVGPSHFVRFAGVSVAPYAAYQTPLGELRVDRETCDRLLRHGPPFSDVPEAHAAEHALEVQLPFVQRQAPEAVLVPLLCGIDLGRADMLAAAEVLSQIGSDQTLAIASSDFTHYGTSFGYTPFPTEQAAERIRALDEGAIRAVLSRDPDSFLEYVGETGATICGRLAIGLWLWLLHLVAPDLKLELVKYERSADRLADYQHSVSYAAIVGGEPVAGTGGQPAS